jgi:tryptophan-rich sensory protein
LEAGDVTTTDMRSGQASTPSRWKDIGVLVAFVAVALLAGQLGSLATAPSIPTWYAGLEKPWFNPPRWVFPVAWTILFILMGVAAWLAWRAREAQPGDRTRAMVAYFVQLAFNVGWSFAFFGAQSPPAGLVVVVLLLAAVVVTMLAFRRLSRLAAALLVPYVAWVSFATLLNAAILVLNR